MENAEVTWHYHMMGSEEEIKNNRPAFDGITRKDAEIRHCYKLAKKQFPEIPFQLADPDAMSWENLNKLIRTKVTLEYIAEKHPNMADMDLDEAIYHLTSWWDNAAWQSTSGFSYADEDEGQQWYVMILRMNKVYRGPQEGGIWGCDEEFIKWTSFNTKEEAQRFVKAYNIEAKQKKKDGDYSILGDDDTVSSIYPEGYIPTGWTASSQTFARQCVLPYLAPPEPWRYE